MTFQWVGHDALRRTWLNAEWERFVGASQLTTANHEWTTLLHPADGVAHRAEIEAAVRTRRPFSVSCRLRRHDGEYRWVIDQGAPQLDTLGGSISYSGVVVDVTDHRLAAQTFRESTERLWLATDAAGIGIHDYRPIAGTMQWDVRVRALWGVSAAEPITYATFVGGLHPDDRAPAELAIAAALDPAGDGRYRAEYRVIARDTGVTRWVAATGQAYFAQGQAVRLVGTVHDISERKAAELAHAESEARLLTILEQMPAAVAVLDAEWRILARNAAMLPFLPWLDAERTHVPTADGVALDASALLRNAFAGVTVPSGIDFLHVVPGQAPVWRRFEVVSLIAVRDGMRGALVLITDIDAARRAADTVREREALFRSMGEAVPDVLWVADPDGRVRYLNAAWRAYVGQTADRSTPDLWEELCPPHDVARIREMWDAAQASGERLDTEVQLRRHDGVYRWFSMRTVPLADPAGGVRAWVGTLTDIEAFRTAQDALRDAARRKDDFLATLAHEMRNPLAPIQHALVVLRHTGDAPELRERAIGVIERQTTQLVRLVDDLLDVSHISQGKLALRPARARVETVVGQGIEMAQPLIVQRQHRFVVEYPPTPVLIEVDQARIAQVISNLLTNAAKYTPPGGELSLTVRAEDERLLVRVRDNGMGVAADRLLHIFDLYDQGTQGAPSAADGLGIGLTLVRRLVEAHGGTVEATSAGLGLGTTVQVELPVVVRDTDP